MKMKKNGGFTLIELLVVITIIAILASFAVPVFTKVIANSQQAKQINNGKQILTAMALFASDKGNGTYPNGDWEPDQGDFGGAGASSNAEACFQDLFDAGILKNEEFLFWLPTQTVQCAVSKPDEDGMLKNTENYWDCISGMNNTAGSLPIIVEASNGAGAKWDGTGGHPWDGSAVVGFADGASCRKENISATDGSMKTNRGGNKGVDLCMPKPGEDGWPASATYAAATAGN